MQPTTMKPIPYENWGSGLCHRGSFFPSPPPRAIFKFLKGHFLAVVHWCTYIWHEWVQIHIMLRSMHGRIYACMSPSKRAWALRAWAHGFNLPRVITYFGETKSSFQKSWILTPSSKVGDTPNALIMPRKVEIYSFEFVGLSVTLFFCQSRL